MRSELRQALHFASLRSSMLQRLYILWCSKFHVSVEEILWCLTSLSEDAQSFAAASSVVSGLWYLCVCWVLNFFLVTLGCPDEIGEEKYRSSTFQTSSACTRIPNKWYSYDTTLPPWEWTFVVWGVLTGRSYPLLFTSLSFKGAVTHCSLLLFLLRARLPTALSLLDWGLLLWGPWLP